MSVRARACKSGSTCSDNSEGMRAHNWSHCSFLDTKVGKVTGHIDGPPWIGQWFSNITKVHTKLQIIMVWFVNETDRITPFLFEQNHRPFRWELSHYLFLWMFCYTSHGFYFELRLPFHACEVFCKDHKINIKVIFFQVIKS